VYVFPVGPGARASAGAHRSHGRIRQVPCELAASLSLSIPCDSGTYAMYLLDAESLARLLDFDADPAHSSTSQSPTPRANSLARTSIYGTDACGCSGLAGDEQASRLETKSRFLTAMRADPDPSSPCPADPAVTAPAAQGRDGEGKASRDKRAVRMLDVGCGDARITRQLLPLFDHAEATEACAEMARKVRTFVWGVGHGSVPRVRRRPRPIHSSL
jgi:hypothetical protein